MKNGTDRLVFRWVYIYSYIIWNVGGNIVQEIKLRSLKFSEHFRHKNYRCEVFGLDHDVINLAKSGGLTENDMLLCVDKCKAVCPREETKQKLGIHRHEQLFQNQNKTS